MEGSTAFSLQGAGFQLPDAVSFRTQPTGLSSDADNSQRFMEHGCRLFVHLEGSILKREIIILDEVILWWELQSTASAST